MNLYMMHEMLTEGVLEPQTYLHLLLEQSLRSPAFAFSAIVCHMLARRSPC
jgi:hypothetical protein